MRFDAFEVDLSAGEIWQNGVRLRLQEQPFQILRLLLERSGKVVSREELKNALWSDDTFVDFDDGLNTAVKKIRDVLGESAEQTRYIETIPRKGYRFKYPVETGLVSGVVPGNSNHVPVTVGSATSVPVSGRSSSRRVLLAVVGALTLIAIAAATLVGWRERWLGHAAARPIRSLVVLPLANLSGDPEQEYFADGMTEALITDLSQVSHLRVISRTSAMHYRGSGKILPAIARELNIDAVIEGSVQRSANRVRVTARLIRVQTDAPVWTRLYERDASDVLLMQNELARAIVAEIQVQLTASERQQLANSHSVNPQAHDAYLLGNYHSSKRNPASIDKGIEYFQRAISIDPAYAEPYAGLANAYFEREIWGGIGINKLSQEIRANTLKALELDQNLAEAHVLLGRIYYQRDWNWSASEAEFRRALELNPNLASAYAPYAFLLQTLGRTSEALAAVHRGVELDPLSAPNLCDEGRILYRARQFDNAVAHYQQALELDPNYFPALWRMADAYEQMGKLQEALVYAQKAQNAGGDRNVGIRVLGRIYGTMGKRHEAMQVVTAIEKNPTPGGNEYALAVLYSALGDRDRALAQLEQGVRTRSFLPLVLIDPQLDTIRSDPRFKELCREAGLPQ